MSDEAVARSSHLQSEVQGMPTTQMQGDRAPSSKHSSGVMTEALEKSSSSESYECSLENAGFESFEVYLLS
jgi:hypothetical protein